jgi:hypothetical protein
MSYWNIELLQSGTTYVADGEINRPNDDLETKTISTTQKVQLANGGKGFMTPETKSYSEVFSMFFAETTAALRSKITTYIQNSDTVRITTHTGEIFTGKFVDMTRVWFTGIEPDSYDISVTFEPIN